MVWYAVRHNNIAFFLVAGCSAVLNADVAKYQIFEDQILKHDCRGFCSYWLFTDVHWLQIICIISRRVIWLSHHVSTSEVTTVWRYRNSITIIINTYSENWKMGRMWFHRILHVDFLMLSVFVQPAYFSQKFSKVGQIPKEIFAECWGLVLAGCRFCCRSKCRNY